MAERAVVVYDLRTDLVIDKVLAIKERASITDLKYQLKNEFSVDETENFIVCTTNREEINNDNTVELIETGDTLYLLSSLDQELHYQTKQKVDFLPHYDTIIKSGMYEYYDSEGQNPLPYAFAELIDNSLAATVNNPSSRKIELRLVLDDNNSDRSVIFVVDNGCGMNSWQLKNWAIYRLSKFIRKDKSLKPANESSSEKVNPRNMPRSLNSEISYFGVGGKQAIFFIGNATRMITKPKESQDVHELCISKEQFEKKELNKEFVYSGEIRNRQPGDSSHLNNDEEVLKKMIEEEVGLENFTCVAIWGISSAHVLYLRQNFDVWVTQLAHIYHYYLHGPEGNINTENRRVPLPFRNIDIIVKMQVKNCIPKVVRLRDIEDDMQTLYIQSAAESFDFRATVDGTKVVEGLLRYHPFLYDHETFPVDSSEIRETEDDHNYTHSDSFAARGSRPIFECFWNGRLIPYTPIRDFEWCSSQKKPRQNVPAECFNRISGVLWTNDAFQVSTNKLTFLDLENRLKDKNTVFTKVVAGQEKRGLIERQFMEWMSKCHEDCDKQIHFRGFKGLVTRTDLQKHRQYPWAVYDSIEWDNKIFSCGQVVRIHRVVPVLLGRILRFMLHGEHEGDVYGTGGDFEVQQEPRAIYDEVRTFPLAKLDRKVNDTNLHKSMEMEEEKLPSMLEISWPEGDALFDKEVRAAGKTIGAIKVQIGNRRKEFINKLPGSQKKLLVELKVIWHSPKGDVIVSQFLSQHAKHWPYWFRKMENVKELGPHTLSLQAVLSEGETALCGKQLPCHKLKFVVKEADPVKFNVGLLDGPFKIGVPFNIPLDFQDYYGNHTKPGNDVKPVVSASGLELEYASTVFKNKSLIIKGIIAKGTIENSSGKNFVLGVKIAGLSHDTQSLKARILPGPVTRLLVKPDDEVMEIENNSPAHFQLSVVDISGNVTCEPRMFVTCKFPSPNCKDFPSYKADLSSSGKSNFTSGPLLIKNMGTTSELIVVRFEIPNRPEVKVEERQVILKPSRRASSLRITYLDEQGKRADIEVDRDILWPAGKPVTGLEFLVYDEGGRPIKMTSAIAGKMKVNWISKGVKEIFLTNKLPTIETPTSIKQQLYCNVSLADTQIIDFGFTIKPIPGEGVSLKIFCPDGNQLRLGESMQSDVLINVNDKHGNQIQKLPFKSLANLIILADEIDYNLLDKGIGQTSSFVVKGVTFTDRVIGPRDLKIRYNNIEDIIRLEIIAGPPSRISYINYDPSEFVTLHSDRPLPHPLVVQLCDTKMNPSFEPNIKVQLGIDEGLKVTPPVQTIKTDNKGQATFGNLRVSVRPNQQMNKCPAQICPQNCRGVFSICAKAVFNRVPLMGALIKIHIPCDPLRPVSIKVDPPGAIEIISGKDLPEFRVQVISEDGSSIKQIRPAQLLLKMFGNENRSPKRNSNTPSKTNNVFLPTEVRDTTGMVFYRGNVAPTETGNYTLQFHYTVDTHHLNSEMIPLHVVAGPPIKLVPSNDPGIPAVSNTSKLASRCLLSNLRLQFQDANNNVSNSNLNGSLQVQITNDAGGSSKGEIPRMVGNVTSVEVPIIEGQVLLQNITIEENTTGIDGKEYILKCTPTFPKTDLKIPPYKLRFLFCNDARKQIEMATLSKERDSLLVAITTYRNLFDTSKRLLVELEDAAKAATGETQKIRQRLNQIGFTSHIDKPSQISGFIERLNANRLRLENSRRRSFGMPLAPEEPGILGKIGELAYVEDEDVSKVLSWHMQSDMDCVVTHTMSKARDLHKKMGGRMQLLPLDSIYRKNLPDWSRPLVHTKIRGYIPRGNPIYARDLLIFSKEPENCKLVFGMLLGDTIILDTLEEATHYREYIVKHMFCPTLLTRTGERIRSNGKFGGQQNKAPPIERLRGLIFGEPPLKDCDLITQQIGLLESLNLALERHEQAEADLSEQRGQDSTEEMLTKAKELQVAEKQLKLVENKLGVAKASNQQRLSQKQHAESELNGYSAPTTLRKRSDQSSPTTNRKRKKM